MASALAARAYGFHGRRMASRVRVSGLVAVRCAASDVGEDNGDAFYMRRCVELARKAVGCMSPNPMVGCVIAKDGKVVGEGFHPKAGQPHAEVLYHCLRGALNWDDILLGLPVSTGFRSVISDSEGTISVVRGKKAAGASPRGWDSISVVRGKKSVEVEPVKGKENGAWSESARFDGGRIPSLCPVPFRRLGSDFHLTL